MATVTLTYTDDQGHHVTLRVETDQDLAHHDPAAFKPGERVTLIGSLVDLQEMV
jgi:hypothetical protein